LAATVVQHHLHLVARLALLPVVVVVLRKLVRHLARVQEVK
jgi:hypothetical protein